MAGKKALAAMKKKKCSLKVLGLKTISVVLSQSQHILTALTQKTSKLQISLSKVQKSQNFLKSEVILRLVSYGKVFLIKAKMSCHTSSNRHQTIFYITHNIASIFSFKMLQDTLAVLHIHLQPTCREAAYLFCHNEIYKTSLLIFWEGILIQMFFLIFYVPSNYHFQDTC